MFFKKPLLSKDEESRLVKAIQLAELKLRERFVYTLKKTCNEDPLVACKKMFEKLNMHQTKTEMLFCFFLQLSRNPCCLGR